MKTIKTAIAEKPVIATVIPLIYVIAGVVCYVVLGTPSW